MLKLYEEKLKIYDDLALQNQKAYHRYLRILAALCSSMAFCFLIYDELDMKWFLIAFALCFMLAAYMLKNAEHKEFFSNYLKNRMLAETVRVQENLAKAGIVYDITSAFSWTQKQDLLWIKEELGDLYKTAEDRKTSAESVKNDWILDQLNYHKKACDKMKNKIRLNSNSSAWLFGISFAIFIIALILEFFFPSVVLIEIGSLSISVIIKTLFGEMSVISLFISSYYGKLSLERQEEDHKKMIALYEKALTLLDSFEDAEEAPQEYKNPEELLIKIAEEEISENANWYIYSKENTLGISL